MKFWNELPPHIIPIIAEARMYHKEFLYAGTPDFLLYNTLTGKYIILDYKTNIDIFKNYNNQKMLAPFEHLLDSPVLPALQISLPFSSYQIIAGTSSEPSETNPNLSSNITIRISKL